MAINKTILHKVTEKTSNNKKMQEFIVNILQEENEGLGWYTKFYKAEIEKVIIEGEDNEN